MLSPIPLIAIVLSHASALAPASVELKLFQFAPGTVQIEAGATVRWTNRDQIEHTVTGGSPDRRIDGWNDVLGDGRSATRTFDRPGTFTYFCDRHHFMRGTVVVTPSRQESQK